MATHECALPLDDATLDRLRAGDRVYLSGRLYTARDAAHERMHAALLRGDPLPIPLDGATIYYAGPSPAPPGHVIGSVGPTTSSRMDAYTPLLLAQGVRAMIGKGTRGEAVKAAMREHGAAYFAATGGAAALLSTCVVASRVVAYAELGTEAIHELTVERFPAIVVFDRLGADLYELGPRLYADRANLGNTEAL